jgi:uncharacterized protein
MIDTPEPRAGDHASDHVIELASGVYLDLSAPDPAVITVEDIAHGLAHTCRYAGHTRTFYSVAEHACLVAAKLRSDGFSPAVRLIGLHHDDAEAFVADIARPLKSLLQPAYGEITRRLDAAIVEALELPPIADHEYEAVRAADDWALAAEAHYLMASRGIGWWSEGLYDPSTPTIEWVHELGMSPDHARFQYLAADFMIRRQGEGR